MRCNIYEEQLQSAELFGKPVLYTEKQVPREAVPEGWHCYDLCGGERQPTRPTELVDRSPWLRIGSVLSPVPLKRATTVARQIKDSFHYSLLGKNGIMLHRFANGQDRSGVRRYYAVPPMKSISNSTTAPRDLVSEDDVKITLLALCESVAARLREQGCIF